MRTKTVKPKKERVAKTRNNSTMSEAAFWGMIRSCLRQKSRWWKPVAEVKKLARRAYKGKNKLQKWEYQCNYCQQWFMEKEIAVDHIIEAGTLTCANDLAGFVERLFVETDGLQVLCNKRNDGKESCHKKKTDEYMKNSKK
jgi:hypothetical protein